MDRIQIIVLSYLIIINTLAFTLYGIDKRKAKKHKFRISEKTLLWMARIGGGIGCWAGIKVFHHKTKHPKFRIIVPLWTIIWVAAIVLAVVYGYK